MNDLLSLSQCPSSTYGSYSSTREYPDDVIFFSRTHPLLQVQHLTSSNDSSFFFFVFTIGTKTLNLSAYKIQSADSFALCCRRTCCHWESAPSWSEWVFTTNSVSSLWTELRPWTVPTTSCSSAQVECV